MPRRLAHRLWDDTRKAAGIPSKAEDLAAGVSPHEAGLDFHDLRGEYASELAEADVPLHLVREALGHSNVTMTNAYLPSRTTVLDDSVHEKLERFGKEKRARKAAGDSRGTRVARPEGSTRAEDVH